MIFSEYFIGNWLNSSLFHFQDVFHERVKTFQTWQHAQVMLGKKRENKAKAEMTGRLDKVSQAQEEVQEVCNLI